MNFAKNKLLIMTGTAILSSALFASTVLASTNPVVNTKDSNPTGPQKSIELRMENGTGAPINLSVSSPEMLKDQVDSLLKSGKITQQQADKILASSNSLPELDGKKLAENKKSLSFMIKSESGDPISLSASSAEALKTQVDSLLSSGKITQQMADKILNSLNMI